MNQNSYSHQSALEFVANRHGFDLSTQEGYEKAEKVILSATRVAIRKEKEVEARNMAAHKRAEEREIRGRVLTQNPFAATAALLTARNKAAHKG